MSTCCIVLPLFCRKPRISPQYSPSLKSGRPKQTASCRPDSTCSTNWRHCVQPWQRCRKTFQFSSPWFARLPLAFVLDQSTVDSRGKHVHSLSCGASCAPTKPVVPIVRSMWTALRFGQLGCWCAGEFPEDSSPTTSFTVWEEPHDEALTRCPRPMNEPSIQKWLKDNLSEVNLRTSFCWKYHLPLTRLFSSHFPIKVKGTQAVSV